VSTPPAFDTNRTACFVSGFSELRAALPGWRVPLPSRIERTVPNPFTGKPVQTWTRDPGPDGPARVPERLRFEHVLLPYDEDWERRYLALDLVLSGEPGLAPEFGDGEALCDALFERGLQVDALFGGEAHSRWVYGVPQRIGSALCAIDGASVAAVVDAWNARASASSSVGELEALLRLARSAARQGRGLFLWLDPPPERPPPPSLRS
jgi:hypothetical protein